MKNNGTISHVDAVATFRYVKSTGQIWWRCPREPKLKLYPAGSISDKGYISIEHHNIVYKAHRLAWFIVTGEWPKNQIDHRNRIKHDNRWQNLREATNGQNKSNCRVYANNRCGVKGVHQRGPGRFRATIHLNKKRFDLGTYPSVDEAAAVYALAAKRLFGEFARAK